MMEKVIRGIVFSFLAKRVYFLLGIILSFAILQPTFVRFNSLYSVVQGIVFVGIASAFLTLLITSGEFDISIGSTAGLAAIVSGILATEHNVNFWLAVLAGLITGAIVGAVNGLVVLYGKVPSFIATISMLFIARSLTTYFIQAGAVEDFPQPWVGFKGSFIGEYVSFFILILMIFLCEYILNHTSFGKTVAAIGSNPEAARIAGINVLKVKFTLFVLTGIGAGLSGVVAVVYFSSARNTLGAGWELYAIAALVIGGTSLFGGRGTVIGLLIGLLIMQTIASGMVVASIDPWWQTVLTGAIVLFSLAVDRKRKKVFVDK
jgi:ribose transport system permease protein